jgi:hypothetical protein
MLFPMTVARGILPYTDEKYISSGITINQLFNVAVVILGLYFLSDAIINLFYWVFLWINYYNSQIEHVVTLEQKGGTIATVAELIAALILILQSKNIGKHLKLYDS